MIALSLGLNIIICSSCSQFGQPKPNVVAADAVGAMNTYVELVEANPIAATTPVNHVVLAGFAAAGGADASAVYELQEVNPMMQPNVVTNHLHSQYKLEKNSFEKLGELHNDIVNYAIRSGGANAFNEKLLNNNAETIDAIFGLSPAYYNEYKSALKNGGFPKVPFADIRTQVERINSCTTEEEVISLIDLSQENKNILIDTYRTYNQMFFDGETEGKI